MANGKDARDQGATRVTRDQFSGAGDEVTWFGNDFRVDGGVWYWKSGSNPDDPLHACEDTNQWAHDPGENDRYEDFECADGRMGVAITFAFDD